MAVLRKKTKATKAQFEASAAATEARRAAQESAVAIRELAQALAIQIKELGLDEKAAETVARVKSSDAYGKAQAKASEVGRKVADNESLAAASENAAMKSAAALTGLGTWLASGPRGDKLGITTAKQRKGSGWPLALLGIGVGYGIGILTAPREGRELRSQLAQRGSQQWNGDGGVASIEGDPGVLAPSGDPVLADKVRTRLGEDPRTSDLPSLNINVVDGTVVVRGPADVDESAVREVVSSVDGVTAVELELGSTSA